MGREAQKGVVLDAAAEKKLKDCVAAVTTFAEMEQFGHEVGRQLV